MKISIFLPNFGGGGAEKVMINLGKAFSAKGCSCEFVVADSAGPLKKLLDLNVVNLKSGRIRYSIIALAKYLIEKKPDVLVAAHERANVCALIARQIARAKTKVVVTCHIDYSYTDRNNKSMNFKITKLLARHYYPKALRVVTVSEGAKQEIVKVLGLNPEFIKVIYNPVISNDLFLKSNEKIDDPWMNNSELPIIVAIGSLTQHKDHSTLISAFAEFRKKVESRLVILGEGPLRADLEQKIKALNIVDYVYMPGFVINPYAYLKKARCFALSSIWEALPTVLIEALALGVPIVSTYCAHGPTEILNNGEYGYLVPPQNVELMKNAMINAFANPRPGPTDDHMMKFGLNYSADRYLELFNE